MNEIQSKEFEALKEKIGKELKKLRIKAGYKSYEVFFGTTKLVEYNIGKWKKALIVP